MADVLTPQQVVQIAKSIVASYQGVPLGIAPLDRTGRIPYEYLYQIVAGGNFRGWANTTDAPPLATETTPIFQFATPGTYSNYPDVNGDPTVLTDDISLITWDGTKAISEPFEVDLTDYTKKEDSDYLTKIPELVEQTLSMSNGSLDVLTGGTHGGETSYQYCDYVPVIPGTRIRISLVIGGNRAQHNLDPNSYVRGVCGYYQNKSYNTIPDDDGLLEGELWSKDRYAAVQGIASKYNRSLFDDIEIEIPDWCYWVRGCTAVTGSLTTPLKIATSQYNANAQVIVKIVELLEKQVRMPELSTLTPALLKNSYIITAPGGAADPGTIYGNNAYTATDKIPALAGDSFIVSLVCSGFSGGSSLVKTCSGIAAYDSSDNFIKAIWDNNIANSFGLYGRTDGARNFYNNIEIDLTDESGDSPIAYLRGSSATSGSGATSPFIIKKIIPEPELLQPVVQRHEDDLAVLKTQVYNDADERQTVTQVTGKYVKANTGEMVDSASWAYVEWPTVAGEVYKITSVCSGFSGVGSSQTNIVGIAGFDSAGNFLSTVKDNGHPVGELWSNDLADLEGLYGRTDGARKLYTKQVIIIPTGCAKMIISTGVAGSGAIHDIELYKVNNSPRLLQQQVSDNTYAISQLGAGGGGSTANVKSIMQNEVERGVNAQCLGHVVNPDSGIGASKITSRFTFASITDIHNNSLNALSNLDDAIAFLKRPSLTNKINAFVSYGDLCNGTAGRTKSTTLNEIRGVISRMVASPWPGFSLIGNHDTNLNEGSADNPTTSFANCLTKADQYTEIISPFAAGNPNLHLVTNKGYFYMDAPDYKIRFIALDAYDHPYTNAGDGSMYYKVGFLYSQEQLDWFVATLNSTPSDYGLVMITHEPHVPGWTGGTFRQGVDLIPGIVEAYKNGSTFSKSWAGDGTYPELATSVNVDFTSRGESEVIIWLCGHAHTIKVLEYKGTIQVIQHCLFTEVKEAGDTVLPPQLVVKGKTEDTLTSWFTWSIDRDQRKVYGTIYGAYEDADGDFLNRRIVIDY